MLKLLVIPAAALLLAAPALAAPGDTPAPAPTTDRSSRANSGIMRYDTNKDGVVDRAEWKAGQEARFKQLDTNKDGKLSLEEFAASVQVNAKETAAEVLQKLDANKDGKVSAEEFKAPRIAAFNRADANKDGTVTPAEVQALQSK